MKFLLLILVPLLGAQAMIVDKGKVTFEKMEDLSRCASVIQAEWCYDAVEVWVKKHPEDQLEMADLIVVSMSPWSAVPHYKAAVGDKKFSCKNERLHRATLSALGLSGDDVPQIADAQFLLKKCYKEIEKQLVQDSSPDSYLFKNSCKIMLENKSIKGLKARRCKS